MTYQVAAYYRFMTLGDLPKLQAEMKAFCAEHNVYGTTLLAPEGINGTMAALPADMEAFTAFLEERFDIHKGEFKYSTAKDMPFERIKIKIKRELITLKRPEADPSKIVGTYVEPEDWNTLINDPEVLLIDTRNTYETELGIFQGAVDPQIETFKEFPDFVAQKLDPAKHKRVAMFCTGGIRCEKASSYMLTQGFENVYHLKGGILKYLEVIPPEESKWDGACFVFDERIALEHGLKEAEDVTSSHGY